MPESSSASDQIPVQIAAANRGGALLIAHVCDSHVHQTEPIDVTDPKHSDYNEYPDSDAVAGRLAAIIAELNTSEPRPDLLIFGGDLTERGRSGEWRNFFKIAETSAIPYHLTLGNHDHYEDEARWCVSREALRCELRTAETCRTPHSALTDAGLYYAAHHDAWQLLFVDSLDEADQPMDIAQRDWLAQQLSLPGVSNVISMHRPFLKVGNAMDAHAMRDPELLHLIGKSGRVAALISGHTHKRRAWLYDEVPHLISTSCYDPIGDEPGYRLICLSHGEPPLTATRCLPRLGVDGCGRYELDLLKPYPADGTTVLT